MGEGAPYTEVSPPALLPTSWFGLLPTELLTTLQIQCIQNLLMSLLRKNYLILLLRSQCLLLPDQLGGPEKNVKYIQFSKLTYPYGNLYPFQMTNKVLLS